MILIDKTGQEFLRNNYIVVTRNNLQVLFLEVEDKLKSVSPTTISKSFEVSFFLSRATSLITPNFTNDRDVRNLIDRCSLLELLKVLGSSGQNTHPQKGERSLSQGRTTITEGSEEELRTSLPSRMTTYSSFLKSSSGL